MALTTAFLNTCRESIGSLTELTTFRAARIAADTGNRSARIAAWHAAYSPTLTGPSPAYLLRVAIRGVVNAAADASGALGTLDRESAYSTLAAEFVPTINQPASDAEELAALEQIIAQEQLS